jgi:hypothetical protein
MKKKAQGSMEYLLLIGGAVLVAVIVIGLLITLTAPAGENAEQSLGAWSDLLQSGGSSWTTVFEDGWEDGEYAEEWIFLGDTSPGPCGIPGLLSTTNGYCSAQSGSNYFYLYPEKWGYSLLYVNPHQTIPSSASEGKISLYYKTQSFQSGNRFLVLYYGNSSGFSTIVDTTDSQDSWQEVTFDLPDDGESLEDDSFSIYIYFLGTYSSSGYLFIDNVKVKVK